MEGYDAISHILNILNSQTETEQQSLVSVIFLYGDKHGLCPHEYLYVHRETEPHNASLENVTPERVHGCVCP